MPITRLLVANRGEIAIRVMRAAAARGLPSVAVFSEDDAVALHPRKADAAVALPGEGAAAYLDADALIAAARQSACDAVHPGYGFLSESADFATRCREAGLTFVGPTPEALALFGDKARARDLAEQCGVPRIPGTSKATSLDEARSLLQELGDGASLMIKAVAGGGGRGVRPVHSLEELEQAFERCQSEAAAAFGNGDLYVERFLPRVRHVEVQVAGDAAGAVVHFGERECSVQRRHQKLVEIAPAPWLGEALRARLCEAAVRLASEARYAGLGTVEFLVDADDPADAFYFIEANARLQVEHTVTEEVTGWDLVGLQLDLAEGKSLAELGLADGAPAPRGHAIQLRVNTEKLRKKDGLALPASGTLTAYEVPTGPGVRTDTAGHVGYATNPRFDSLLAKVIVHSPTPRFADAVARAERALCEFRIEGIGTNLGLLQALLRDPAFGTTALTTRYVEENARTLVEAAAEERARLFWSAPEPEAAAATQAGAKIDASDPLAVLDHGKSGGDAATPAASPAAAAPAPSRPEPAGPPGSVAVRAPLQGTVVSFAVAVGDAVTEGQPLLVLEAMKMEHVVVADREWRTCTQLAVAAGDTVFEDASAALRRGGRGRGPRPGQEADERVDLDRTSAPTWPRSTSATAHRPGRPAVPRRSRVAGRPVSARRGRTSPTSATRAPSSEYGSDR